MSACSRCRMPQQLMLLVGAAVIGRCFAEETSTLRKNLPRQELLCLMSMVADERIVGIASEANAVPQHSRERSDKCGVPYVLRDACFA